MVFEVEITNLMGEILATTRSDRAGEGPSGGDPLVFQNYSGLQVEIPLADSRTARMTCALANPVVQHLFFDGTADGDSVQWKIGALGRMLRVYYRGESQPVFWGPILMATADMAQGTYEINAHDPTLRLKHHYANFSDPQLVGDPGDPDPPDTPQDYRTVRDLIIAAQNLGSQSSYPDLGIKEDGSNDARITPWVVVTDATGGNFTLTVNGQTTGTIAYNASAATVVTALEALSNVDPGEATVEKPSAGVWGIFFTGDPADLDYPVTLDATGLTGDTASTISRATQQIERGSNVWDEVTQIRDARYGPDLEFEPRDDLGLNANGWSLYCQMNTYERQGTDRYASVVFRFDDTANANLSNLVWEPSGDQVKNQVTIVKPDTTHRLFGHDLSAWLDVGIYAAWENPIGGNAGAASDEALQDFANDYVKAQARPPQFVTITPRLHAGSGTPALRYLDPYELGDEVRVIGEKGYLSVDERCRITKVTLRQADAANNVQEELELVPAVTSDSNVTSGLDS